MDAHMRTKNFSSGEVELLLDLVKKNSKILENKRTGRVTQDQKEKCWGTITEDFNSLYLDAPRSAKALKTKYYNLKADVKKRNSEQKKYMYGTGGGAPIQEEEQEFDKILIEIMPENQINGMNSKYDSDFLNCESSHDADTGFLETDFKYKSSVSMKKSSKPAKTMARSECCDDKENSSLSSFEQASVPKKKKVDCQETEIIDKDYQLWEHYTPAQMKEPKNKKLRFEREKAKKQTSWEKLAEVKANISQTKMNEELEMSKAEHKIEIHEMHKEKHQLEMRLLLAQLKAIE